MSEEMDPNENHVALVRKELNGLQDVIGVLGSQMDELSGKKRGISEEERKETHFQSLWASLPIELASCTSSIRKVCRDLGILIHSPGKNVAKLPDPEVF